MKWLSRTEEMILLAVHALKSKAYGLAIRNYLKEVSGKRFSIGAIYIPLGRLEKKGMLSSRDADPTPERGGRSKRYYELTTKGLEALGEVKSLQETLWEGFSSPKGVQIARSWINEWSGTS